VPELELGPSEDKEIENILPALEKNDFLCELADTTPDERRRIFNEKADKH